MPITQDSKKHYEIETIIGPRVRRQKNQYLIRWKGYDASEDLWIEEHNFDSASDLWQQYNTKQGTW